MVDPPSEAVEKLLAKPELHRQWVSRYRTADNEPFYERVFDSIIDELKPPPGSTFLDVGCGSCQHSVRLARRGMRVHAVDFSESALQMAAKTIQEQGIIDLITLGRENVLNLSFPDANFDYVLCWGVLMHIPDIKLAISELSRVVKPGGSIIVSETNMRSMESVLLRGLKRILGRDNSTRTEAGLEFWKTIGSEQMLTRQDDIAWLIQRFKQEGMGLQRRVAGQFSEGYALVRSPLLKRLIHGFNNSWFGRVHSPGLAFGNILFLKKGAH